jgi:hypothetical protein
VAFLDVGTPSFHRFRGLDALLSPEKNPRFSTWLSEFLRLKGFQGLFEALTIVIGTARTSMGLTLRAIARGMDCIRKILESEELCEYLLETERSVEKISCYLMQDSMLKVMAWETLAALCNFSQNGRARVVDALAYFSRKFCFSFRFSIIVKQLEYSERVSEVFYTVVLSFLVSFLNEPDDDVRHELRLELMSMGLLDVLNDLRPRLASPLAASLFTQFFEMQRADEEALADWNKNPLAAFADLSAAVAHTPYTIGLARLACQLTIFKNGVNERGQSIFNSFTEIATTLCSLVGAPPAKDQEARGQLVAIITGLLGENTSAPGPDAVRVFGNPASAPAPAPAPSSGSAGPAAHHRRRCPMDRRLPPEHRVCRRHPRRCLGAHRHLRRCLGAHRHPPEHLACRRRRRRRCLGALHRHQVPPECRLHQARRACRRCLVRWPSPTACQRCGSRSSSGTRCPSRTPRSGRARRRQALR